MRKRFSLLTIIFLLITKFAIASTNPFTVTAKSPVQNMVAGSAQSIHYLLTSSAPQSSPVVVTCSFTPNDPSALTYSFNSAGCASGGVGLYSGITVDTLLTLTVTPGTTSAQSGTLVFHQTNGRGYTVTKLIHFTVAANSQRTITFNNYCVSPNGAGNSTGNDIVLGVISSSVPAVNQYTSNTACSTNADCAAFTYSTCINSSATGPCNGGSGCYCGGGACVSDNDCLNNHSGTCVKNACSYCAGPSQCIAGASCNTTSNICFFNFPTPSKYQLSAFSLGGSPDSATLTLADNSAANGFTQVFNGRFTGRVGCTLASGQYSNCNVADCGTSTIAGSGACNFETNAITAPATLAEATFIGLTPDTYDLSIIGGVSMSMVMYPSAGSAASPDVYNNPYICGIPGSITEVQTNNGQQNIGASSWSFSLPSYLNSTIYQLRWVDASSATTCSSDATCQALNVNYYCGMTRTNETGAGTTTCGKLLGYWSFDQICTDNNTFTFKNANGSTIASCTSSTYDSNTYFNLLACSGDAATSCFNVNSPSKTCCGCVNWQNLGLIEPTDSNIVMQCTYPNPNWVGSTKLNAPGVLPFITWQKQACPGCYVFPYDDKTSTFGCPGNNGQSAVNYTIDFCPENKNAVAD